MRRLIWTFENNEDEKIQCFSETNIREDERIRKKTDHIFKTYHTFLLLARTTLIFKL